MDIIEELRKAHKEYLQDAWDAHLVDSWYRYPKASIRHCASVFMKVNNIKTFEELHELKRTPKRKHQWHACVTRFIAAYLPKLSISLWGSKLDREELLKRLKATKMDTLESPVDAHKQRAEKKEETDAKRDADAYSALRRLRADARLETAKSNWKHCK